jgi:hypothetical protein
MEAIGPLGHCIQSSMTYTAKRRFHLASRKLIASTVDLLRSGAEWRRVAATVAAGSVPSVCQMTYFLSAMTGLRLHIVAHFVDAFVILPKAFFQPRFLHVF